MFLQLLSTYLTCPLQFYFRYLAGIKEPEEIEESMAANTFGSVFHLAMEYLYQPFSGNGHTLTQEDFKAIKKRIEPAVKQAFKEYDLGWDEQVKGRNYLLRSVILTQCKRVVELDAEGLHFKWQIWKMIRDTFVPSTPRGARSGSTAPLIELTGSLAETYRILDYKTGKVYLAAKTTLEDAFQEAKHKQMLQGYLYTWLFDHRHPQSKVQVGFVPVKQVGQGIQYLAGGKPVEQAELVAFERELGHLVEKIYTQPFTQTEDEQICSYCPYNMICNRG